MKILLILIILTILNTCTDKKIIIPMETLVYENILEFVRSFKTGYNIRKTQCITNSAKRHNLDPWIFAKLGAAESSFDRLKVNTYSGTRGLGGVHPKFWSHLSWKVFNGRYFKYCEKNSINYIKVMHFIGAGTEMSAIILRIYLNRHDNDYRESLISYGGWRAKRFKHRVKKRDKYVNSILDK